MCTQTTTTTTTTTLTSTAQIIPNLWGFWIVFHEPAARPDIRLKVVGICILTRLLAIARLLFAKDTVRYLRSTNNWCW